MKNDLTTGILFTDQYQLTMAQLYFKLGLHEKTVQFEHFFRSYPDYGSHQAGFCINAGLEWFIRWLETARFGDAEIDHLRQQHGRTGQQVFHDDFLDYLRQTDIISQLTIDAIPEGRVVHPFTPLTLVRGPVAPAQILETALLNKLNFQTLIATKAARIKMAAQGQLCLEFGLRRGPDLGGNAAARAALIGGADFSSNVGLSASLGLTARGTHAHSFVQLFLSLGHTELDAFRAYTELYPDNCILLVDTINALESGIPNAITVFEELRRQGHEPIGVRIDSGDLAFLCMEAAKMLDRAGFANTSIVLSNDLDEMTIWQIVTQIKSDAPQAGLEADKIIRRLVYGVGTRLVTSHGAPALGGVYKLTATREHGIWRPSLKVSENIQKTPNPGLKSVWRFYDESGNSIADVIGATDERLYQDVIRLFHPTDFAKNRHVHRKNISRIEPLLTPIVQDGKLVYDFPSLEKIRAARDADLDKLHAGVKRLINPHVYHVSLTEKMFNLKQSLMRQLNGQNLY